MKALIMNCSPVRTGATAAIVQTVADCLSPYMNVKSICIDDYRFAFCTGCRSCHHTAKCVQQDDVTEIMREFTDADCIVCVSPSYWADVPGQFKAFIDRCTPWCNTHEPHTTIPTGKCGFAIALRTGPSMRECDRVIETIEHFYGHLDIACCGHLGLPTTENRADAQRRQGEIDAFCEAILEKMKQPQ